MAHDDYKAFYSVEKSTDLRVQFGVEVGLITPNADLHDAVHIFLDEVVVIQYLHSFAGALGSVPLQRAQQRVAQVVQVVQVNRRPAAHGPTASKRSGFNMYQ